MSKRTVCIVAGVLLAIGGTVWALRSGADPQVEKILDMQKELFSSGKMPQPEQRKEIQMAVDQLTPKQREKLDTAMFEAGPPKRMPFISDAIDDYFAAPPDKRNEVLDKQIQEMDKLMASMRPPQGQPAAGASQGQAAPGQGANNGTAPPSPGPNRGPDRRQQWRNRMLDSTTPEQRAKFTAYFGALQQRRIELGLPAFPPFPGRPASAR